MSFDLLFIMFLIISGVCYWTCKLYKFVFWAFRKLCGIDLLEKIRNFIFSEYDSCYKDMEHKGIASMNCCGGVVGGTSATEYLSEKCIDCPYFVVTWKNNSERKNNENQ